MRLRVRGLATLPLSALASYIITVDCHSVQRSDFTSWLSDASPSGGLSTKFTMKEAINDASDEAPAGIRR